MPDIRIAGGSVPGSDHTKPGQPGWTNNHDAFTWKRFPSGGAVAIVGDGCGSGSHSEVGSKIGVNVVANLILEEWAKIEGRGSLADIQWHRIKQMALGYFSVLAKSMGGSLSETVNNYFLFTLVGAIVTPTEYCVFSLGDGIYILNGKKNELGPFPNNSPPYLLYGLTGSTLAESEPGLLDFKISNIGSVCDLEWLLIGTDGVADLIELCDSPLPGRSQEVGPIEQFLEGKYFDNPDLVRRRLALVNREILDGGTIKPGPLGDDTTFIVFRNFAPII